MANPEDLGATYLASREDRMLASGSGEMLDWLMRERRGAVARPVRDAGRPEERELDPFPTDQAPPAEQSTIGQVGRNVSEVPKQILGGVDDAGRHALQVLNPLTDWLNANVADLTYDPVGKPKTGTGAVTRSVSEFLTGFVPALKGLRAAGMTGKVLAPGAAAMISDFAVKDPHEKRLSNLWQEAGLPSNVLTDYLASDVTDTGLDGRFKSAAESAFTGAALEGVVLGARALRATKGVGRAQAEETALLKERYGEITDESFSKLIGDPSKPMIETRVKQPPAAGKKLKKGVEATAGTKPDDLVGGRGVIDAGEMEVFVNFGRMTSPDDVKAVIAEMAERGKGSIVEAQRGAITRRETAALAESLGMGVPELLARTRGQAFNAEQITAARKLYAASGEKLLEAAKAASDPNAGPLDQFAFRKMLATHHAIQAEVLGARTEAARALGAWKIPVGGGVEKARAIDQVVQAMGGPGASQEMARRLAILAEHGDPAALARFVERGWGATTLDAVREVWINGLLSSPATHIVNTASNTAVAFQSILERGVAARIGELRGTQGGVAPGEAMAMAYGLITATKDAFRLASKAFTTGETGWALNKVDLPMSKSVSSEAFGMASETGMGRMVDFLGDAARIPSRFLGAEDEFFKTIGYRMELHAQALRRATEEGAKGPQLATRMREIVIDPPENLRIAAADAALYQTFTNAPGAIGQAFMNLREKVPAVTFVLPFVRTPVNIARYTFERTPFAPLVSQWRDEIAAGGARADLALARMATGTGIMLTALDWADSGFISGRGPSQAGEIEAMKRQGWQPYSVKVGNRWYSYNRTDPFGAMLGFAADAAEAVRRGEMNEDEVDEWQEVMAMGITAVSQVAINKTYLQGVSEFVNVMSDPKRYSEPYINKLVSSFIPYTALAGAVERTADPVVRDTAGPWQSVQAKLLGLSESLPARRTLWGEEISTESGLGKPYDFFSPVASREVKPEPIDTEIMRLAPLAAHDNVEGSAPTRIGKRTSFNGVQVNFKEFPEAYEEYVRLAGNELKHPAWGVGAKDFLNAVVSGNHPMSRVYNMRSDEMKITFIKQAVSQYRQLAQQQIMADPRFRDFSERVGKMQAEKRETRMPVVQ